MNPTYDSIADTLIRAVETADHRRSSPRVALNAEVDLSSDTNFFNGFSTDIAMGGLFVATLNAMPVGTEVALKFKMPNGKEIQANGEVRWLRAFDERCPEMLPGMGVQFVDLDNAARTAIAEFIAEREPMFFPD